MFKSFPNVSRVVGAFTVQANNIMQIDKVIDYFINEMGIVFYSHRVNYPRALSAQTLPSVLKEQVIEKLEVMKTKILDYPLVQKHALLKTVTLQQIQDNINFLKANDLSRFWPDCVEFNRQLDKTRNQNFLTTNPEFINYV